MARRPLHFIWLCDCSGSMSVDGKIQALNNAIREATQPMREVAKENPNANVLVRALKFSNGAQWCIATPTEVDSFRWEDLDADGVTDMGKAMRMVAEQLKVPPMDERALPPVLVLITDGQPTDDFKGGLQALMDEPWGKKSVRVAIAIGEDADLEVLQKFIGHPEMHPLQAHNAETLVSYIKWVSTAVLKSASQPASQATADAGAPAMHVPVPAPPDASPSSADDVW